MMQTFNKIFGRSKELALIPLQTTITMPSKEELEKARLEYKLNEDQKLKNDCEYMMNLLNKTLNDSIDAGERKYIINKIDKSKINDYNNITIKKCLQYEKYMEELNERDVKLKIVKTSSEDCDVTYNRESKELMIFTRWP